MPKTFKSKKLVLVLATSVSMISASKKTQIEEKVALDQIFCIHYPV